SEHASKRLLAPRIDGRHDHEGRLRNHGALLENLITGRLVMGHVVHRMSQLRKLRIHPAPSTALVTQGAMLGNAMPRIVRKTFRKLQFSRRVEGLPGHGERSREDEARQ